MPEIQVDLREAITFEPVEPATYEMVVDEITGPHEGPNSIYVTIFWRFADPAIAKKSGRVIDNRPISGAGAGFFRDFWKKVMGEDLPDDEPINVDTDDAIGQEATVEITNELHEERLHNRVRRIVG